MNDCDDYSGLPKATVCANFSRWMIIMLLYFVIICVKKVNYSIYESTYLNNENLDSRAKVLGIWGQKYISWNKMDHNFPLYI